MAEVFLARDVSVAPARLCVLKRILPEHSKNPDYLKMFHDEARLASSMSHQNVVKVFELARSANGPFIVMEYLAGQDLFDVINRAHKQGSFLPWDFAVAITAEAAAGVGYAHQLKGHDGSPLNIVHRDLTPSNVFVTWDGVVKVLDFGIAHAQRRLAKTQAGMVKGKAHYLAPEQITGKPFDGRADQFALGVVLYELLTGRPMFDRDNELAVLHAILEAARPDVRAVRPDVPDELFDVLSRATATEPSHRYPTMQAFREALLACLGGEVRRDALADRLRSSFATEFETHARLMGRLATAGTDELSKLYDKARHADASSSKPTEMVDTSQYKLGRAPLYVAAAIVAAILVGVAIAASSKPPAPAADGIITIRSEPVGARVTIDGTPTPWSTPFVADRLTMGKHKVTLLHPERAEYSAEVELTRERAAATVDVVLPKLVASLELQVVPDDAAVTVDGAPVDGGVIELSAGEEHVVKAVSAGYVEQAVTVELGPGERKRVELALEKELVGETDAGP